jgi:outer membrane protein OmpA-like peptidoglycan-associated protein
MRIAKTPVLCLMALAVAGCSTTQDKPSALEEVQTDYERVASQPFVQQFAPEELDDARRAVAQTEEAWQKDADEELIRHYAYIAERRISIAEEAGEEGRAEQAINNAETERQQVLLKVRETQANRAQTRAEQAEMRARELEQNLANLESEMETIKTEKTAEGIVLTLQDILFDTNEATLKPNASATLDKVAAFLNNYERRQLEIKGYTDSTGSEGYNQELSERRARSVEEALVARGVLPGRIDTSGFGERYPVASNDTAFGRQQNRRVEILIANPELESSSSE